MMNAEKVAAHVAKLSDWQYASSGLPYGHMGATLTDAVLQSGITYETVVLPRVNRILQDFPNATTTSSFAQVLQVYGAPAVLKWKGEKKLHTLAELISLLLSEHIETEQQFRAWMEHSSNVSRLYAISGIGDKTADYLKILVGAQALRLTATSYVSLTKQECRRTATTRQGAYSARLPSC